MNKKITFLMMLILALLLVGCTSTESNQSSKKSTTQKETIINTTTSVKTKSETKEKTTTETIKTSEVKEDEGFDVTITADEHVKVYVYDTQDYSVRPSEPSTSCKAKTEDGVVSSNLDDKPQVNLELVFDEGYELDSISATANTYKNIKGPSDTLKDNVYRFTVINSDTEITVTSKEISKEEEKESGFIVSFEYDSHVRIYVYDSKDYETEPTLIDGTTCYARTENGEITKDTTQKPQVNILLVFDEGYELDSISATENTYKNIKNPEDTGKDNVYRFTVINSDTTITVTSKEIQK